MKLPWYIKNQNIEWNKETKHIDLTFTISRIYVCLQIPKVIFNILKEKIWQHL